MEILKTIVTLCGTLVVYCTSAIAQGAKGAPENASSLTRPAGVSPTLDRWADWQFLVGEWTAEGGGAPGQGTGTFSFQFDLQGRVLTRKNHPDYPATKDRPAFSHQDLMIVYAEPGAKSMRAIYFDNEGHVIRYTAGFTADRKSRVFVSDAVPRYRLIYTKPRTTP